MNTTLLEILALVLLTAVTATATMIYGAAVLYMRNVAHALPRAVVNFAYAAWIVFALLTVFSGALVTWRAAGGHL